MSTRQEIFDSLISDLNKKIESDEIDKKSIAKVIGEIGSKLTELITNHHKVITESKTRKDTIAELNAKIDTFEANQGSTVEELEKYKSEISDLKVKISESETKLTEYNQKLKNDFLDKVKAYKITENEDIKGFYNGLDNPDELTPEQVNANMAKLTEHEKLGVFKDIKPHVENPSDPTPKDETEEERLKRQFPHSFK